MTTWSKVEVGTRIVWDGEPHEVRVVKRAGKSMRIVLAPLADGVVAKLAVKVGLDEEVHLLDGEAAPDLPKKLVEEVLGGTLVMTVTEDEIISPKMDTTLIASHLKIVHGVELEGLPINSEDELMKIHEELHAAPFHEPKHPHRHEEAK